MPNFFRYLAVLGVAFVLPLQFASAADWVWKETPGESLELHGDHGLVWRLKYGPDTAHFHFDHLAPVGGGTTVWASPPDHVWHYGLWFSWKFINSVNYWEIPRGGDGFPTGRTILDQVQILERSDAGVKIKIDQSLHAASGQPKIATESVLLSIETPRQDGSYAIDWRLQCDAKADLEFSSSEKGYGGLSIRTSADWTEPEYLAADGDRTDFSKELRRVKSQAGWMDVSGRVGETQPDQSAQHVGVTFFDHPSNLRYPNKWYSINSVLQNRSSGKKWPMYYNNASLFADGPISLPSGESLVLKYRVYVHNGRGDVERLNAEFQRYQRLEE